MRYVLLGIVCCMFVQPSLSSHCPEIISKMEWGGRVGFQVEYCIIPVKYVIFHHTVTPECNREVSCSNRVSSIQDFHMDERNFHDIGYNFIIGGDGNIYEGIGWHKVGAHTWGYNTKSCGIAFIGDFMEKKPNSKQLEAAKSLLRCGVHLGELDPRYKLLGARQVRKTNSPGLKLYQEIQSWPNFAKRP